jgi:hypothetical protein
MAIPFFFRPRVAFSIATGVAGISLCRTLWRLANIVALGKFIPLDNNMKGRIVIGVLGGMFVLALATYSLVKFEINCIKLEDTYSQLGSESGVWAARKMWIGGFYLACICIIASLSLYDLIDMSTR